MTSPRLHRLPMFAAFVFAFAPALMRAQNRRAARL
jgi:hypothetical protein